MGPGTKLRGYFNFHSLYNIWKDQLYRISGSEFDEWLFRPKTSFRNFRETRPWALCLIKKKKKKLWRLIGETKVDSYINFFHSTFVEHSLILFSSDMTRNRRFKVQLGFAALVMIIVICGWRDYDLSDKMTRNALSRTKEISGMYERAYEYPAINAICIRTACFVVWLVLQFEQ